MNLGVIVGLYISLVQQGLSKIIDCEPCKCTEEFDGIYLHCNGGGVHEYPKDIADGVKSGIVRIILTWTSMNSLPYVEVYEYPKLNGFIELKNQFTPVYISGIILFNILIFLIQSVL